MTQSSINRIVRQFGDNAHINQKRLPKDRVKFRKLEPLVLGFKALSHAEKGAAKKDHRERLAKMAYANPQQQNAILSMCAAMRATNRRNGIGRPPLYKRFLVNRSAA